jgi:hypothetical protein
VGEERKERDRKYEKDALTAILSKHPAGLSKNKLIETMHEEKIGEDRAKKAIQNAVDSGLIYVEIGRNRTQIHRLIPLDEGVAAGGGGGVPPKGGPPHHVTTRGAAPTGPPSPTDLF